ncbi:unnamed protein product [Phytophthora fragariaefolia]|uniref:Unnamed protein product n=1 Tax=Phytophthora fragariaefolia TaxID=1490495 RepID=A0A9W6XNI8_9STRA|nr:unnamed protein product [Phytophthora fragariaefolia]
MGKAKKLRSISHKKRVPPTGGPTSAEIEELQAMDLSVVAADEAQLFKGLVDLQGAVREATCVAIATMFGDVDGSDEAEARSRRKLQRMVDAGLLKKLIPRVVDPLPMVRQHALGALRNISVTGGLEVCELMTAQNVVTPLVKVITENATDAALSGGGDLRAVQLLEQAVALLANLCESCQAAINELTQGELLPPIFKIAAQARSHMALHLETLKLLLLISEANAQLNELIGANAAYQQTIGAIIQAPADQLSLQVRLEAVGIATNLQAIMQVDDNVARMVPVLEAALAYDAVNVVQMAQQASENYELSQKSVLGDENVDDDTLTSEEEQQITAAHLKVRTWRDSVHTLTLALEIIAQLASSGDENDDEEEWASDDEDAMEEYAASHMDTEASIGANGGSVSRSLETSRDFEKMRIRICNAINNLLLSVSWEVLGEDVVPQVFRNLCALYGNLNREVEAAAATPTDFSLETSATNDMEVAVTAAMFSALRRSTTENRQLAVSAEDAQLILSCAAQGRSAESRLNAIGMIGCVGKRCSSTVEKEAVGCALVSRLDDSNLEVVAETLNAIFDVYDDEEFDDTFRALNFLSALERTSSALKAKLKAEQKQLDRALVAHVKETRLNLLRFIKYKKKHLATVPEVDKALRSSTRRLGRTYFCVWLEEVEVVTTADDASVVLHTHSTKLGYVTVDVVVVVAVKVLDAVSDGLVDSAIKAIKTHQTTDIPLTCMVKQSCRPSLRVESHARLLGLLGQFAMQFTPQQLVGAGRYAPSTRIGNWNEDLMLEEARMKEFTLRKAQGSLLATHTLKAAFLNQKAPRSFDPDGHIRFNQAVALGHLETDALLACNIFEETPSIGSEEYLVTGISGNASVSRNTFRIVSPQAWKAAVARGDGFSFDFPGEPLRYDEPFLVMCNEALLVDDKSVLLKPPLFLKSGLKTEQSMSPITYKQRVWLSAEADSSALWTCVKADLAGTEKLLAAGQQVVAGDRIAVVHKMTGQALFTQTGAKQPTDFGVELEISTHAARGAGKRHHLAAEIEGTRTPDTEGHPNLASNTWTFVLARSAHEAQDDRTLPQFASVVSVIDVLRHCLAADSLYTFRGFLAVLSRADKNESGHLSHEEAKWVIRQQYSNLPLRDEHLDLLFDSFDKRKVGIFPLAELLKSLRIPILESRRVLIEEAYDRLLQRSPDGKLTLSSICAIYDPSIDSRVGAQQLSLSDAAAAYRGLWPKQVCACKLLLHVVLFAHCVVCGTISECDC